MRNFWKNLSEEKPVCYNEFNGDGKLSDFIFFTDEDGVVYVGQCNRGEIFGEEFCYFLDKDGFDIDNVTHWAEIPLINDTSTF
jgi:hypothetical protein